MNQQQQIQLLNSIMPQIVETRDPEATMLKCARKNNLSPAQLEKLGHVYNTMKTIVGLEKQANRGDSFSILDVPKMVSKYTTYDASAELSARAEKVHDQVDALMKDADSDGWSRLFNVGGATQMSKAAATGASTNDWLYKSNRPLPRVNDWLSATVNDKGGKVEYEDENMDTWMEANAAAKAECTLLQKTASAVSDIKQAKELWEQTHYESATELNKQCEELRSELLQDREKWAALVMDARDILGTTKAASALDIVEAYFAKVRCHSFEKAASINRGYVRRLADDSTGLVATLEEILELDTLVKRSAALLSTTEKNASMSSAVNTGVVAVDDLLTKMRSLSPEPKKNQKKFDEQLSRAKTQTALENLMLNDKIIAEADPATVQDLHATISSLSPTIANDPVRLAPVLKEALQYDALPIQQIKDILSVEEAAQKVKKLTNENARIQYN